MLTIVLVTFWAISAGFVTAGLFASFYQLMTNSPVSFRMLMDSKLFASIMAVPILLFSGPMVITRNAWHGRVLEQREWGWILASAAIVTCWSFITGVIVLEFAFSFFH
jgi:hypothetical protein